MTEKEKYYADPDSECAQLWRSNVNKNVGIKVDRLVDKHKKFFFFFNQMR